MNVQQRIPLFEGLVLVGAILFLSLMPVGCGTATGTATPGAPSNLTVALTATWLDSNGNQKAQVALTQAKALPISWTVGPDDTVTLDVSGHNPQGVQDAQIWISPQICRSSGTTETCSQPLTDAPVRNNPQPPTGNHPTDVTSGIYLINIKSVRSNGVTSVRYDITGKALSYTPLKVTTSQLTVSWP